MPEIPEIEVIIDGIRDEVLGARVKDIIVFDDRRVDELDIVKGRILRDVVRNGKAIILKFGDIWVRFHLRLTGFVRIVNTAYPVEKGWIVGFFMDNDKLLILGDKRKLAEARIITADDIKTAPDAMNITEEEFISIVRTSKAIKSTLMDQNKILGLGNRYVDEILWRSKVHPARKGNSLTQEELNRIFVNMKEILQEAYNLGGDEHYTDVYGNNGKWSASVHGKKVCPICGATLQKIKIGGRTSYICPNCQKEPRQS